MARLVKTIAEVQEYIRVGNGLDISTLTPALNEVEMDIMTYYLGDDLIEEIAVQNNTQQFTPRIAKIIQYVLAAHACLAVWKAGPELEVLVSDSGIMRTETNTEKSAWGGQVKRFRDVAADRGFKAIDSLLLILETYEQDYPEWQGARYYEQRIGLMIRSASEFEAAGESINGSALTFQSFRPILLDIQEQTIRRVLPETLYQQIMDQLASNSLSPANQQIMARYILPALAKLTVEESLTTLPVVVSHSGVNVNQIELASDSRTSKLADMALIEKKAWTLRGRGQYYLSLMREYLNTNAVNYPLWFNSDFYSKTLKAQIEEESILPSDRRIYRA